ncbi:MAG: hypothetical protein GY859_34005, partial [Desulfobacterales bacterium]|nr:hypothetical protein [Desulfobacterales bacterium]
MFKTKPCLCCLLLICVLVLPASASALDAAARNKYVRAENCRNKLLKSKNRMQHRQDWQVCIDKFMAVYRRDPAGAWAPAGLYMAAKLHLELYEYSGLEADRKESFDLHRRIINRFPSSKYREKAQRALDKYARSGSSGENSPATSAAEARYLRGKRCFETLKKQPKKQALRHNWTRCIERFEAAHDRDPGGPWAAASLYRMAELYLGLYKRSIRTSDKEEAIGLLRRIV